MRAPPRWSQKTIESWRRLLARRYGIDPCELTDEVVIAVLEEQSPYLEQLYERLVG